MHFKTKVKRVMCAVLSTLMLTSNIFSGITAFAVEATPPVNADGTTPNGNKPQDTTYTDSAYINDTPIRLQVSKVKTAVGDHEGIAPENTSAEQSDTVTYLYSGRIDGSEAEIIGKYGSECVELAYSSSGIYLGYGWKRGTLETLLHRQEMNLDEEVQILYNEYGVFEGYGYITKKLETADDTNRYVAGATMGLYDAVEIFRNPEVTRNDDYYGEDERFTGVTVIRDSGSNNVTSVYVNKGYAGTQTEYVLQKEDGEKIIIDANGNVINDNYNYQDEINDIGKGTWIAKTIQREDTPILFYSLDNLQITSNDTYTSISSENTAKVDEVFGSERFDKAGRLYGFDQEGNVVDITQKDERDFSIYAFEAGTSKPVYEFVGGNYNEIKYNLPEKVIEVGHNTVMYHLDENGNRDSLVDPQTGIAYIEESIEPMEGHDNIHHVNDTASSQNTKLFVWPVNIFYDGSGSNMGNGNGSMTFRKIMTTRLATFNADTENEYTTGTFNGTKFEKSMNPVLDQYGHPVYYRKSDQTYVKGSDTYDYDGDEYTGYTYKDSLDTENEDAYTVNDHDSLYNGDKDDPFNQETHYQYSDKQAVRLTIDATGNYIVNGSKIVPTPVDPDRVFAGWLMEPNQLTDGCTVKAYWRNKNGSGMSTEEKEQWYSDRSAQTADVKTMTVTFDANGGEFRSGSGDIHSTDNILYRRLGDGYLMENVWLTGENTPNDPFDTQLVDTVGNTANNTNTITGTGSTGNDAYSNTTSGGQTDMLKRVNDGIYIMEELKAPEGYVKGLPVGVTLNEHTQVQFAEMVDETIKIELAKTDAATSYTRNLYLNGELQKNDAGTIITVTEPMGSWSYNYVKGATLALKGRDAKTKKALSEWVTVTNHPNLVKKMDGTNAYFEFSTTTPVYIEGIPAGNYVLSEVVTPDGFVKMDDQNLTVTATSGVQLFTVTDDHTKVEIEKYYNDGDGNKNLPNSYRAELSLLDEKQNVVSTWYTDDISDYTNSVATSAKEKRTFWESVTSLFSSEKESESFIELFTDSIRADRNIATFSWDVTREAVKAASSTKEKETWIISDGSRIVCENGSAPDSAPQIFIDAYNTRNQEYNSFTYPETMTTTKNEALSTSLSNQIWDVSNGSKLHICVYGDNDTDESGRESYYVEFKFNYRDDYEGIYSNMISYDTVDGRHRFDYLPDGQYTLRETGTPEGFVTAADKVMDVLENGDVQRFTLENKRKQLSIAKTAKIDDVYYAGTENGAVIENTDEKAAAVISGAQLKLYYSETPVADYQNAFANGATPDGTSLADSWTSGGDGTYTESDYKMELIRKDQIGDYKPHIVTDIANGYYYLVESSTPAYYKTFAVKEIHVTDKTTSDVLTEIEAVNTPIPVEVKVFKQNEQNSPLSGAMFLVKNKTLGGIEVGTLETDSTGYGTLSITDTARFSTEGKLEPYTFTIQEIGAPAGYQINPEIHEFTASASYHDVTTVIENKADGSIVNGVLYVTDTPSQITISKSDFNNGESVPGTTLSVHEAVLEGKVWKKSENTEHRGTDWTWTIQKKEKTHAVTGLTAGGVYVLTEDEVPAGYTKADDIFFKVSASGTAIEKIWYDPEENVSISFTSDNTGAVESVTFTTRTILGTYVTLEDLDSKPSTIVNKGTLTGGEVNLHKEDVTDGHRYRMKEYVKYSDSTTDCLSTTTFIAKLYEGWMKVDLNKELESLTVDITDENDKEILSFTPDNTGSYTVANPLISDSNQLEVVSSNFIYKNGLNHSAVQSGNRIYYRVTYSNAGEEIIIVPADGLSYLSTGSAELGVDGNYHFTTTKDNGTLTFVGQVKDSATRYINQKVSVGEREYSYMNPIAVNKGTGIFENSSKLVISSAVAGTHLENENAAFTFKITLSKADGSALDGSYDYFTQKTNGTLYAYGSTKEFEITLNGNDFITVCDLPYNTQYSVVQIVPDNYDFVVTNTAASGKTSNTSVSNILFTNTRNETSERSIFEKNTGYVLTEHLNFTEDESMVINKYGFSFGEKCEIKDIAIFNKPTEVWFTKTDWTTCEEVEGATCVLMDMDGTILTDALGNPMKWVSGKEPTKFVGVLEAGKSYRYHEEKAPDGYGYSEDIIFTVSEDGTIDKVIMQDKPTVVSFTKEDFAGVEIPGASCELKVEEEDGTIKEIDSWISGTTPHVIEGTLTPNKTYHYHEAGAPNGYAYCEDIVFTLDENGIVTDARYVDEQGNTLVYDKNGYPTKIVVTVKDDEAVYTLNGEIVYFKDGNIYDAQEKLLAEGVKSEIEVKDNVIQMKDAPFNVTFTKEDFAGKEIPGATCELEKVNPDGSTSKIDKWVSDETPHVMDKELTADTTYRYHEELAPEGYGYSEDIEFTINKDGVITDAHYINEDKKPILFDKDGFPTDIIVNPDGTYTSGEHTITIDENGNAVDENGEIHAEGVEYQIPVVDNVIQMKDAPTELNLLKVDSEEKPLANATFQIFETNGSAATAVMDTKIPSTEHDGMILKGEKLIFKSTASTSGITITGQLKAGAEYTLRENLPPSGYIAAEDATFKIPYLNQKEPIRVIMENEKTVVTFTKEDYAGVEIPGASCELEKVNPDGTTTTIDKWVSDGNPKTEEGVLETDTTYRYHEELAPEGYGYSEDIEFTINKDGVITDAHYINEDKKPILFDKDGFPTDIVVNPDGTYTSGEHTITIDENGNAVDENGEIHAEGVEYQIPVVDNVIQMKDAPTEVFIQKLDDKGTVLSGGKFQILNKDKTPVRAIKDTLIVSTEHEGTILAGELIIFTALKDGVNITGQLKSGTEYVLRELEAPNGHIVGEDETFYVPYLNQKEPLQVPMKNIPTKVTFTKEDYAGVEISGATCELEKVNPDGTTTTIDKWVSTSNPKTEEGVLETDTTYRYHEELAPEGYGYSEDIEFTINKDGVITDAHYINEDKKPILFDKDGFPTDIIVNPDGTYTSGEHTITIDENGNAVDENGEIHAEGVEYQIPVVDNVIQMKDAPTKTLIVKTDLNGNNLEGGMFQIMNADGTAANAVLDSQADENGSLLFKKGDPLIFSSKTDGVLITGQLKSGTDYFLHEIEAPAGCVTGADVKFHVPYLNQKEPIKVTMKNQPTKAEILKVDQNDIPLAGAKLEIRDAKNGDLIDNWTSDGTAHTITGLLTVGKEYLLIEETAPNGYYKSNPVTFSITDKGTNQIKMVDEQIKIKLIKTRKGTDEQLSGGKFSVLRKSDGTVIIPEFELNGEITISGELTAGETYLFHEVAAPSGYLTSGDIEFTIPVIKANDVIEIKMEDTKKSSGGGGGGGGGGGSSTSTTPTLAFHKYDGLTMQGLSGAEFTIYDSKGEVYKTVTTGSDGRATVTFGTLGDYTYRETKAPQGYTIDDTEHAFKVTSSMYLSENVANYKNPPKVTITKKDSETGDVISGVRFEITNENGTVVFTETTDSYGQITFAPDEYGAYAVREINVPSEYEKSDGYITFTVGKGGVEGETTFYNDKKETPLLPPPNPTNPTNPTNPGKRAGIIDASYSNGADGYGTGWFDRDGNWHPFATPGKTGDYYPFAGLAALMLFGFAGLIFYKKKKGAENESK